MKLRPYQIECHDAVLASLGVKPWWDGKSDTYRSVIANLATASGKTIIAAFLIKTLTEMGFKCLFLADTDELCKQPLDKLHRAVGIYAGLEKADSRAPMTSAVVVGSVQTMSRKNRLERFDPYHFDFIVVDEAHRGCDRAKIITEHFLNAGVCGMTATAFRSNLADLSKWYDTVAYEKNTFDMIGEGWAPPIRVQTIDLDVDLSGVKQATTAEGRDFQNDSLSSAIEPHLHAVAKVIKDVAPDRQILTFLPLIATSKMFVDICQENGISAVHCDGTLDNREEILYRFERKEFQVLSNSQLFSTGVDFITCDCLLNLRPTRSVGFFRQMVGRILRPLGGIIDGVEDEEERKRLIAASDKPDTLILDLLYNSEMGLAGPATLISDAADQEGITKRVREARSPEDLAAISEAVRQDREEALRAALEEAAKRREESEIRYRGMMDAELVGLWLHETDYEPAVEWEKRAPSEKIVAQLEKLQINPSTVRNAGHASRLMNICWRLVDHNRPPIQAFPALHAEGITDPLKISLDDAIKILKADFPMTFGKHAGTPLKNVPYGYWCFIRDKIPSHWIQKAHPAAHRYMTRVVFAVEQQPELMPV